MSFDISLKDPVTKETLMLDCPHQMKGGTYAIEGTSEAWLNVTYNYSSWYHKDGIFPESESGNSGIRCIDGMSAVRSVPVLTNAIAVLGAMDEDISAEERRKFEEQGATGYWMPTRENAIKPLHSLLALAQMRPDGVWSVE